MLQHRIGADVQNGSIERYLFTEIGTSPLAHPNGTLQPSSVDCEQVIPAGWPIHSQLSSPAIEWSYPYGSTTSARLIRILFTQGSEFRQCFENLQRYVVAVVSSVPARAFLLRGVATSQKRLSQI